MRWRQGVHPYALLQGQPVLSECAATLISHHLAHAPRLQAEASFWEDSVGARASFTRTVLFFRSPPSVSSVAATVALHITAGQTMLQHASVEPISADQVNVQTGSARCNISSLVAVSCNTRLTHARNAPRGPCPIVSSSRCSTARRASRTAFSRRTLSRSTTRTRRARQRPAAGRSRSNPPARLLQGDILFRTPSVRVSIVLGALRCADSCHNHPTTVQVLSVLWTRGSVEIERVSVRKGWAKPKCAAPPRCGRRRGPADFLLRISR